VGASENPQEINDILSEKGNSELSDRNYRAAKDWYDNANGEGVNDGWFFSVLGGGKEQRKYSLTGRVPVSFDNTLSAVCGEIMRFLLCLMAILTSLFLIRASPKHWVEILSRRKFRAGLCIMVPHLRWCHL
jgi:hypothetical protein